MGDCIDLGTPSDVRVEIFYCCCNGTVSLLLGKSYPDLHKLQISGFMCLDFFFGLVQQFVPPASRNKNRNLKSILDLWTIRTTKKIAIKKRTRIQGLQTNNGSSYVAYIS